jgi:ribosome-binding protein aMBF1 (putative translation factor)
LEELLPVELTELILLLTAITSTPNLSRADTELIMSSDLYSTLPDHLPTIAALISSHLTSQASHLVRILKPTANASFLHRSIPTLPNELTILQTRIEVLRTQRAADIAALTALTVQLSKLYTDCAEACIRLLEGTKHGAAARNAVAHVHYLNLSAQAASSEASSKAQKAGELVYPPDSREALRTYAEHLRDARARAGMRKKDAEAELARYGVGRAEKGDGPGKEKVMREMARVYGEMLREIEEIERDMKRLQKRR